MFDIGFSELLLVLIVGLVVLGPKRLPIAIRTVMGWVRTIRGLAANVQNELAQELKLQELKDSIKKAEELNLSSLSPELSKTVEELKQSAQQMQANLNTAKEEITKLSDEQVAEIQAKIEAESKSQEAQTAEVKAENVSAENSQETAENAPLANEESPAEVAENAELDEQLLAEKLSIYYPLDDDEPAPQTVKADEKEQANGKS